MMKSVLARSLMLSAAFGAMGAVSAPQDALAGAFGIREQSAYSQGASFAGNAACGNSIQGTYWNSAAITCLNGKNYEGSLSLIVPKVDVTTAFTPLPAPINGDAGQVGKIGLVPSSTSNWQVNDRLFLGMTTNGPFGLGNKTAEIHAGSAYFREGDIFSLNFNPVIGYKISDYVSIGAGVAVQYFDLKRFARGTGVGFASTASLSGDDWGFGFTAGVMINPSERTSIGIGYRSRIEHTLKGDISVGGIAVAPISAPLTTPDIVTFSFRHMMTEKFTLLGTVEWTNWSTVGTIPVTNRLTNTQLTLLGRPVSLPLNYEDGWFFSLGGEYQYSPDLTLRAGIGYEKSPIDDISRSISLPDNDRLWLSTGFTYQASERLTVNGAATWITGIGSTKVDIRTPASPWFAGLPYAADVDADAFIFSAGIKYKFGHLDEQPLVTKY